MLDTNLLLLLAVGRADPAIIEKHKRLRDDYTAADFHALQEVIGISDGIVVVPQVLAEVSNLARQIANPARTAVMGAFGRIIANADETYLPSRTAVDDPAFYWFGLTDAMLLLLCSPESDSRALTLVTADGRLAYRAESLGFTVLRHSKS